MTSGPAHYRHAENDLGNAMTADAGSNAERHYLASAQVHATLALAAATALNDADGGSPVEVYREWSAVAGSAAEPSSPKGYIEVELDGGSSFLIETVDTDGAS